MDESIENVVIDGETISIESLDPELKTVVSRLVELSIESKQLMIRLDELNALIDLYKQRVKQSRVEEEPEIVAVP
tara:strand:+ start:4230 stop:4454 length:225 start_codon:yes stop_codon:yes gene_type:complete